MADVAALIERASNAGDAADAEPVILELLAAGPDALRQVIETADRSSVYEPALYDVIRRSTGPEAARVLRDHAGSARFAVVLAVLTALAASDDRADVGLVVGRLADTGEMATTRAAAAEALYGTADPAAVEALRTVLEEQRQDPDEPEWPTLLVRTATALATTGDHRGAEALYPLWDSPHDTARSLAVAAFRVVTGPSALAYLARAAADPSREVRQAAIDPVFLLGAPASVEILLRAADTDDDPDVRHNAVIRVGDILGLALGGPEDLPFALERWEEMRAGLDPGVCYRFGTPIDLTDLREEFAEEAALRASVAEEVRVITGVDVPFLYRTGGLDAVQRALEPVAFTAGAPHKWGHPQRMPDDPELRSGGPGRGR